MAIKFSKNVFTWADTIVRLYLFSENVSTPKEPEEVPSRNFLCITASEFLARSLFSREIPFCAKFWLYVHYLIIVHFL